MNKRTRTQTVAAAAEAKSQASSHIIWHNYGNELFMTILPLR